MWGEVNEELDWFNIDEVRMASVSQMMKKAGKKDASKVQRFIEGVKKDYAWPRGACKKTAKAASKLGKAGGLPGWAATEACLRDLHRALRVP